MQGHSIIHDDGTYSKQYSSPSDHHEISISDLTYYRCNL